MRHPVVTDKLREGRREDVRLLSVVSFNSIAYLGRIINPLILVTSASALQMRATKFCYVLFDVTVN